MKPMDHVLEAFDRHAWTRLAVEPLSGRPSMPNPSRVDLVRGKQRLSLIAYAWKITGEGKGRTGTDYRIQTTRSHETDLLIEPPRLTLGFGVDPEREVIAVFDGWTKRWS